MRYYIERQEPTSSLGKTRESTKQREDENCIPEEMRKSRQGTPKAK